MEAIASTVLALPGSQAGFAMRKHHAHLSDEALVALVARGDESALAELYDRVGRIAYGLALRILRDDRHAEDAVQEAFLQVWRSAATFRAERAKASTWILTLVHRRAVDLVRREERLLPQHAEHDERDDEDDGGRPEREPQRDREILNRAQPVCDDVHGLTVSTASTASGRTGG